MRQLPEAARLLIAGGDEREAAAGIEWGTAVLPPVLVYRGRSVSLGSVCVCVYVYVCVRRRESVSTLVVAGDWCRVTVEVFSEINLSHVIPFFFDKRVILFLLKQEEKATFIFMVVWKLCFMSGQWCVKSASVLFVFSFLMTVSALFLTICSEFYFPSFIFLKLCNISAKAVLYSPPPPPLPPSLSLCGHVILKHCKL